MAQIVLGQQKEFLGDIFGWWYSKGIYDFFIYLKAIFLKITDIFSVRLLLRTFFSPWKRDVTPMESLPLNLMLQVIIFNLVSRLIGAFIKAIILFIYFIALAIFLSLTLFLVMLWLLLPLITILGLIIGIGLIISG
jgi:hypothetical protein